MGYHESINLLLVEIVMKYLLFIIFAGNPHNGMYIPFEDMAACQDAKTIIVATAPAYVTNAYCFPSSR